MAAIPSSEAGDERGRLEISSRFGAYAVVASASLAEALARACEGGKAWILADEALMALHGGAIRAACPAARVHAVAATEGAKSFEHLGPLITAVLGSGFRRDCTLVAIGGGVIQDIAAFLAAILMRGVAWEFIPTTLLAQCDSCIGAKSSINIASFKNQLGCFLPPRRIHLAIALLGSLPAEAIRSGMGEIVKFHLVEGPDDWQRIRAVPPEPTLAALEPLIWRSLSIKRRYIEADELDTGLRNILNYGHTFGHAFESVSGFAIPHGIAVALGMAAATWISHARGMVDRAHRDEVLATLRPLYGKHLDQLRGRPVGDILAAMRTDKKNVHGATYVILTAGPGAMRKTAVDLEREIATPLQDFLARDGA
jgi:3-dehydroquinate synthase